MATFSVQNTRDISVPWTAWFVYGNSGTGKTTIASTFPKPLFLVPKNEDSATTLRGQNFAFITLLDRSSPFKNGMGGLDAVLTVIEDQYAMSLRKDDESLFPYQTIVLESMTHYCDLVQDELTDGAKEQMSMDKWGKLSAHLRNVHARLRALDVHVVYTALSKVDKDGKEAGPHLPGQSADKLPSACDVYAYVDVKDQGRDKPPRHTVYFRQRDIYPARTRFQGFPGSVENFKFNDIKHLLYVKPLPDEPVDELADEPQPETALSNT